MSEPAPPPSPSAPERPERPGRPERRTRVVLLRVLLVAVLVPAAVLTVLRLVQPGLGPAVRVVSFTPFGLPGYALAAVLAALLLVWGRRQLVDLGLTALVVLGLVLHSAWVWPLFTGATPEPAGDRRIVMMTVNASYGDADADAVVAAVREDDVEVLAVSEIDPYFLTALEVAGLEEVLPHRAGFADPRSVVGTMLFSREPTETLEELDTTFRGYVVRTDGLTVVAVHPQPPTYPELWRRDHARILAAAERHDADVVVGDLNATLDHAPLRRLVDAGWRDAVELTNGGFAPTWPAHGEYPPFPGPVVQIDHVMVSHAWTVTDVGTVDIPDTDHLAVVATLAPTS